MSSTNQTPRPTPLRAAFRSVGGIISLVGAAIVFLGTWGVLSADQAHAIDALLAAVPGLITLGAALLASFGVVVKAEPLVTPLEDPQDDAGRRLVPEIPPMP